MNFGLLKERFVDERRVALSPAGVANLTGIGAKVYVERDAGFAAGWNDAEYVEAGAEIVYSPEEAIGRADVVVKVFRPTAEEVELMHEDQTLLSYLQLPLAHKDLFDRLIEQRITAIGLENIEYTDGGHPVRRAMSEIAGALAVQVGARYLTAEHGGRGILFGGVPGVPPASVGIIGAGVVGSAAAAKAMGMGAHVILLDHKIRNLRKAMEINGNQLHTAIINQDSLRMVCSFVDVLICAVLIEDLPTPHLISREVVRSMKRHSVIVDVAIDQGGTCETTRPTTISNPTYKEEGVIHYAVPNMTSSVPRSATRAFQNQILPYLELMHEKGVKAALEKHDYLVSGLNLYNGHVTREAVAKTFKCGWKPWREVLK